MGACESELAKWSESISAIALTGLSFSESLYERERYQEILKIVAEMRARANLAGDGFAVDDTTPEMLYELWLSRIGKGTEGYVTPKVSVAAVVRRDPGEILLIQRGDSGVWLYPTGWADVGYSPAEVVVKEVLEETGIEVEVVGVLAVLDGMRSGFTAIPMYSIVFLCRVQNGSLSPHPLEVRDLGWFHISDLPSPMPDIRKRIPGLERALDTGIVSSTYFDPPRIDEL